jgi:hypothetical protein
MNDMTYGFAYNDGDRATPGSGQVFDSDATRAQYRAAFGAFGTAPSPMGMRNAKFSGKVFGPRE